MHYENNKNNDSYIKNINKVVWNFLSNYIFQKSSKGVIYFYKLFDPCFYLKFFN